MGSWGRHAVVAGQLEHHCLLCEETFTSTHQVERHIRWPEHRTRREAIISNHQQADQPVYKIRELYYCEACNCALVSEQEARAHVELEEHTHRTRESHATCSSASCKTHKEEGSGEEARRVAGGVVLFGQLYCGQRAWNGICGGSCLVCNVSVEEATEHCASRSHLLRLLSTRVRRHHTADLLYRQINEWFFHCVTCNKVLPQSLFTVHGGDEQHVDMFARCRLLASRASAPTATLTPPPAGASARKLARRHTFTDKLSPYARMTDRMRTQLNKTQITNK